MQNFTRSFVAALSLSGSIVCFGATGHAATTTGDISVTLGHASGTHIFLDKGTGIGALVLFGSALVGVGILGRRRKKPVGVV
jgi:hypothetical protein